VAVIMTSPTGGKKPGETYTGPLEAWYIKQGYARATSNPTDHRNERGALPAENPMLASNREDPGDPYAFGTDAALAPYVRSLTPDTGDIAGGTQVTADGDNFTGVTAVTVGGVATTGFSVVDDNTIQFTTGAHEAGEVDVLFDKGSTDTTVTGGFTYTDEA
jgi:hypothetical protein